MRLTLLLLLCFLGLSQWTSAQKVLQLERYGRAKTKKFYIGDELTYRLKGDKTWYKGTINDLLIDEKIILFEYGMVKMEDISTLKTFRNAKWSRKLSFQLYLFGVSWGAFSLLGTLVGTELTALAIIVPAVSFAVGWLIRKIFKSKKHRLGRKRWLRMLDLTMVRPGVQFGP